MVPVPDESWIEAHGGEHGEDDDGGEAQGGGARGNGHDGAELNEANEDGDDKDIDHGPASKEFGDVIKAGEGSWGGLGATAGGEAEPDEGDDFKEGDEDAGGEDDDGDGIGLHFPKAHNAGEDGVFFGPTDALHGHDRHGVGGNVKDDGGDEKGPGAFKALGLAQVEGGVAAGAMANRHGAYLAADVAGGEALGGGTDGGWGGIRFWSHARGAGAGSGISAGGRRLISSRSQSSSLSIPPMAAALQRTRPMRDQSPVPNSRSASLPSLRRLTTNPSRKTSSMLQGSIFWNQRAATMAPGREMP